MNLELFLELKVIEWVRKRGIWKEQPLFLTPFGLQRDYLVIKEMVILAVEISSLQRETLCDQDRVKNIGKNSVIVHPERQKTVFDLRAPTMKKLKDIGS